MALIVPVAAPAILSLLSLLSLALIVPLCLWLRPLYCLSLCVFYVCTMCLPQREHVLFGVVKWKLDVQLYWLDCRRNQEE